MFDLSFISELYIPIVLVACLIIGYCIKSISWLDKVSNEYIPTICAVCGAIFGCIANSEVSLTTIVAGAVSGLAATGLHQAFTQIINKSND